MDKINSISFPQHWESPKYHLGQLVKQGLITGMEYYPKGTIPAKKYGEGWSYTVISDDEDGDTEGFGESSITPLDPQQVQAEIQQQQALIAFYQANIAALAAQLEAQSNET